MASEKDQPATAKKLRDARRDGEIARCGDAAAAASFSMAIAFLVGARSWWSGQLESLVTDVMVLAFDAQEAPLSTPLLLLLHRGAVLLLPISAVAAGGAVVGSLLVGGVTWSLKPLALKFQAIDPVQGVSRLLTLDTLIEAVKMIVKALLLGWLLTQALIQLLPMLVNTTARTPMVVSLTLWAALENVLLIAAAFLIVLAMLDVRIQRKLYLRRQRMSKEDIKREYKESEGDPEIKQKRKELAHELVMDDGRSAVESANALIMNPTHYAVALHYHPEQNGVPIVAAKGRDDIALMMRRWAEQAGVPIAENPPLARTLHRVPIGAPIPRETYSVVALVLKWATAVAHNPTGPAE